MTLRASLLLRWSRALLLGVVVTATGSLAHVSAAGLLPGPLGMTALLLTTTLLAAAFLGREASTWRLAALVVGGQAFVHTGLAATGGHLGDTPHAGAGHVHGTAPGADPDQVVPSWLSHAFVDMLAQPGMALTHFVGALAVGLWLAVGERALWTILRIATTGVLQLARQARARLAGLTAVLVTGAQRLPRPDAVLSPLPQLPVWSRGPVRRGPPQVLPAR